MNNYEVMLLVDPNWYNRSADDADRTLTGLFEKHGGAVERHEKWDERKLAYPIRVEQTMHRRGIYWLCAVKLDPATVTPLRADLELSPNVIRSLILARDEVEFSLIFDPFPEIASRRRTDSDEEGAEGEGQPAEGDGADAEETEKPRTRAKAAAKPAEA